MRNPWLDLPASAPFVLPADAAAIARFNERARADVAVHLELLPEPFLGDPLSPVVLLGLNPGFSPDDAACHADPTFAALSRANLEHLKSDFPFYLLNPAAPGPGRRWWSKRLRKLIEATSLSAVANRVLCVEFFGYHSDRYAHRKLRLPSQDYGVHLLRQAMARNAVVVVMRSRRFWFDAVPELASYPRRFSLRNVQSTYVSPRNCPDGFDAIVAAVKG